MTEGSFTYSSQASPFIHGTFLNTLGLEVSFLASPYVAELLTDYSNVFPNEISENVSIIPNVNSETVTVIPSTNVVPARSNIFPT